MGIMLASLTLQGGKLNLFIHPAIHIYLPTYVYIHIYTECHGRNGPNFGRVFLMLNYTDITQNTYIQS